MLQIQQLSLYQGNQKLLENINLQVSLKQCIGIVGANGCGKSSLFSAIRGILIPHQGDIQRQNHLRIAHLAQETESSDISALDYALAGDKQLATINAQLAQAEKDEDYEKVLECHSRLADIDGYSAQARASKILHGLGFADEEIHKAVTTFSGGWRMRLNLAQCLMSPSDILLLDEPTNHLDLEAIIWLEKWLKQYTGAILIISHDRDFLDGITTHIAHIENCQLNLYTGNYSFFEIQRAQTIALQNAQYKKQQNQIKHMMSFVDRFRSKATKAKQAQSRLKAIERMEKFAFIHQGSTFQFSFREPLRQPNPLLRIEKAWVGYGNEPVLKNVNLTLQAGSRVGLLGVNGAGKSTLIKLIAEKLVPEQGTIEHFAGIKIGYFAQHQLDYLNIQWSAMDHLLEIARDTPQKDLQSFLGSFGYDRDQASKPIVNFSGGEKARLALALLVWQQPNLLLLDEPTNHLDLEMRAALMLALQNYQGAMVLISHDRYLLRHLVDELYFIHAQKVGIYTGDVSDYQQWVKNQ